MKVVIKRKAKDEHKSAANLAALSKLSHRVKRKQLKALKKVRPLSRVAVPATTEGPKTKVTLKVNTAGNLRGMHNAANPPDSEHMKRIRAMRRFYNKQMPVLQCNGCAFASSCPQFKAGYECAFLPFLNSHRVDTPQDLLTYMKEMCGANMRRAHLMTLAETLGGGKPSLETTEALNIAFEQIFALHSKMTEADTEISVETDDGGIIGKIFGGLENLVESTRQATNNPIDVPPVRLIENAVDKVPEMNDNLDSQVNHALIRETQRDELDRAMGKKAKGVIDIKVSNLK